MYPWIVHTATILICLALAYIARQNRKRFEDAYFLLQQWRDFGKSLSTLYPEIYEELRDHKSNGDRWDMRRVNAAAAALAKIDKS